MRSPTVLLWLMLLLPGWGVEASDVTLGADLRSELLPLKPISGRLHASDLEQRVVVVSFFASWCPPCRTEFQHLNTLKEEFGDTVSIIAINVFEAWDANDAARMKGFLRDTSPSFAVVEGSEDIKRVFGDVQRIPTVFVFAESGAAALHFIHKRNAEKMTAGIEELREAVRSALSS